jgi:hypothetical protein
MTADEPRPPSPLVAVAPGTLACPHCGAKGNIYAFAPRRPGGPSICFSCHGPVTDGGWPIPFQPHFPS